MFPFPNPIYTPVRFCTPLATVLLLSPTTLVVPVFWRLPFPCSRLARSPSPCSIGPFRVNPVPFRDPGLSSPFSPTLIRSAVPIRIHTSHAHAWRTFPSPSPLRSPAFQSCTCSRLGLPTSRTPYSSRHSRATASQPPSPVTKPLPLRS